MRILLIRHGEPDYVTDTLTAQGRAEAELLSRRLDAYHIRDFYVSPLGRARETAGYTLRRQHREAETLPWLAEFRGHYPDPASGRSRIPWDLPPRVWAARPELFDPEAWADSSVYAGGNVREIWEETKSGVSELLGRYGFTREGNVWRCDRNTRETLCLFCHFGISVAVLACLFGVSPVPLWHHALSLPSSLTEVVTEERVPGEASFRLLRFGDITHLEAAGLRRSTAGLFPECCTGVDSTDPRVNGELPWEL